MLSPEDNNYYMPPQGDEGDGSWKPHMQQQSGAPPHASKLNTWANKRNKNHGGMFPPGSGPPPNFNGSGGMYKGGWPDGNRHTPSDQNKVPWSDPLVDRPFESFCDDVFGMNLGPNPKMGPPPNGTPHQWGHGEINQSTPWDIDARAGGNFNPEGLPGSAPRFMQPVSMDNGTGQWRSWEHDGGGGNFKNDFHHPGNFPPHMSGMGKMHGNFHMGAPSNNFVMQQPGGFNDRMMRNGPPQMQPHPNQPQQQQPGGGWMDNNKYGGGPGRFQAYGAPPQAGPMNVMPPSMVGQRGAPFIPPPLASAHPPHPGMQPPPPMHHQMPPNPHMQGAGPPTGHQQGGTGGQFSVGTFSSATVGMVNIGTFQPNTAAPSLNDDSVWHDPNGDLRKWQRDTGTAAWGDPTKQAGQQIRRWQQADENDPLAGHSASQLANAANQLASVGTHAQQQSPDSSLKKGVVGGQEEEELVVPETGWGDLPPLNGGAPIPHAPPPGPGPQLGGNGAWMSQGPTPQPLTAQNPNVPPPGAAWADPQRSQQNMPPTSHPNFYSQPPNPGTPTDWSQMSFGGGASGSFNPNGGSQQPPQQSQQIVGSFEGAPNGGQGSVQGQAGQDPSAGSTNEIADKLRMAASKGWINPMVFCSNNKLSTHTASLLNTLINRLTAYEQNTAKITQLQRQESASGGSQAPNSSPQRAELDRLIRETAQMSNELTELRDKIHNSMDGSQRANKGMSLADELSNMNTMPIGDVPLW